ncbi:MAG: energy-coupling factor transporter transmembrane component T, partial [Gemmataceae bacterium]
MLVRVSPPPLADSAVARLDPRWRLAGVVALLVGTAVVRTLPAAGAALALSLLLAWRAAMPWRWYRDGLLVVATGAALFALPLPLLSRDGWADSACFVGLFLAKAAALYTLTAVLLVTAPLEETLKAARALRVPSVLVQVALLAYRYLFLLAAEFGRLRVALRVRGFRNRADLHSYHTVSAATGTLLVRGHDRAERVAQAMRCRGF